MPKKRCYLSAETATTAPSKEARDARILRLHENGHSEREIARQVGCSRSTVWNVIQKAPWKTGTE